MNRNIFHFRKYLFSKKTMGFYEFSYDTLKGNFEIPPGISFELLTPEDLSRLDKLLEVQRAQETVFTPIFDIRGASNRLQDGEFCFACEEKGEILGYIWYAPRKKFIREISSTISLKNDEIYVYNAYMNPACRGKNLTVLLHDFATYDLEKRGFKREIMARMIWNESIHRAMQKAGATHLGICTVSFFLTLRFFKNDCRDVTLVDEGGMLEFYRKFSDRMK